MSVNLELIKKLSQKQIYDLIDPVFIPTWNKYFKNSDSLYAIPIGNNENGYVIKTCMNRCEDVEIGSYISYKHVDDEIDFSDTDRSICRIDVIHQQQVHVLKNENIPKDNLINIQQSTKTKPKKRKNLSMSEIEHNFCISYIDAKMSYLSDEEFGAMKYYEDLMYNWKYRKQGMTLERKMEMFHEKYPNVTNDKIKRIHNTRVRHMGYAKKEFVKIFKQKEDDSIES